MCVKIKCLQLHTNQCILLKNTPVQFGICILKCCFKLASTIFLKLINGQILSYCNFNLNTTNFRQIPLSQCALELDFQVFSTTSRFVRFGFNMNGLQFNLTSHFGLCRIQACFSQLNNGSPSAPSSLEFGHPVIWLIAHFYYISFWFRKSVFCASQLIRA